MLYVLDDGTIQLTRGDTALLSTVISNDATGSQTITPTAGKVLSKVSVAAIPAKFGDVSTATGAAADVLAGKIVFGKNASGAAVKITGTMANNGATGGTIDGLTTTSYTIPAGYTSGGTVTLSNAIETALAAI